MAWPSVMGGQSTQKVEMPSPLGSGVEELNKPMICQTRLADFGATADSRRLLAEIFESLI